MFELMPFNRRRNEASLFDYLDSMERSFFGDMPQNLAQFRTDILDRGDHYELQAELPGFEKEDIHIGLEGDVLTVTAEHREDKEVKQKHFVRRERKFGSFSRSFDVSGIDAERIDASYKHGVLTLELPKAEPSSPNSRQIDIR